MCSPRTNLIYFVICLVGMIETMLTVASEHIVNRNHPFYISVCSINHNIDTNTLEISFQFFTDDLEQALEINGTGQIYLGDNLPCFVVAEMSGNHGGKIGRALEIIRLAKKFFAKLYQMGSILRQHGSSNLWWLG